jgi:hypothetical protein
MPTHLVRTDLWWSTQTHLSAASGKCKRQLRCKGALANAALARKHQDFMFHFCKTLCYCLHICNRQQTYFVPSTKRCGLVAGYSGGINSCRDNATYQDQALWERKRISVGLGSQHKQLPCLLLQLRCLDNL